MALLSNLHLDSHLRYHGVLETGLIVILILTVTLLLKVLYNVYLHPLSKYPGPRLAAATRLWYCYHCVQGNLVHALHEAHQKYGDVVRTAPNELSYTHPKAWNDIYGHRGGKGEMVKDPTFYSNISSGPGSIINAEQFRHRILRKQASHGFSERALRSQEDVIKKYADLMLERLEECAASENPTVDIVDWYNFFTFDVMGDLVFGQSFDCLTNWGYHPWVQLIFDSVKAGAFVRCTKYWPFLAPLSKWLVPSDIRRRRADQRKLAVEKAEYRKSIDDGRHDLISGYLLPDSGITALEYQSTVETLIIAGSETTATLMSGVTYYLLRDPERMAKVKSEIRGAFSTVEQINLVNVNRLPYLLACLDEALRVHPPVPDTFPRNTGPDKQIICGKVVPPHTTVGVHQWSTYHSPRNFKNPDDFIPERWLQGNNTKYEGDRKDALQPFHVGPRNCLGRNLAYFEMRLLMARLLWRFDLELDPRSVDWNRQEAYLLWEKPPMFVKLVPRHV
ncbi:cytochrome P450 monooxygenase monooxygenase [Fusarium sp. NRRL 25303]|nr:cytochrome P450 monooxygenase monooxygenase [Fusarium sp. NRRL 25303]